MTKTITPDGERLAWVAHYWRSYVEHDEECDSLEDAVAFLAGGTDQGTLSYNTIRCPDGRILDRDQVRELVWARLDTWDAAWDAASDRRAKRISGPSEDTT